LGAVFSSIVGGSGNSINGIFSTIGGGSTNIIGFPCNFSVIAGGLKNRLSTALVGTIGGGWFNFIDTASYCTIAGGVSNRILDGHYSTIAGGLQNTGQGVYSSVLGGTYGYAMGEGSIVVGGSHCTGSGYHSVTLGGFHNLASGRFSIAGGEMSRVSGNYGIALGRRAYVPTKHSGSVLFADGRNVDHYTQSFDSCTLDFQSGLFVRNGTLKLHMNQRVPIVNNDIGVAGEIAIDNNYIYVCIADNSWKLAALSTF
jgi:hypothetical protein